MQRERSEQHPGRMAIAETAMAILGLLWMALLILELTYGLGPVLNAVFEGIWIVFVLEFVVRFILASDRGDYLKANWLVGLSLLIPAIRVLRVFRVLRLFRMAPVVRGVLLARLFASSRRSMRALGHMMRRRGFAYVVLVTLIVTFVGAAGMYAFEKGATDTGDGFTSYWDALWWTAMLLTTIGSQYWPVTAVGRILAILLSIYAVSVLGYIAAVLASYFIGRDANRAVSPADIQRVETLVRELREEIRSGRGRADAPGRPSDPSGE